MSKFDDIERARQAREAETPPMYRLTIPPRRLDLDDEADVILATAGNNEQPETIDIPRRALKQSVRQRRIISYGVDPAGAFRFRKLVRSQ